MRYGISSLALAVSVAGAFTTTAQAQTATSTNAEDIVVTARRVEERLQDVPISITVFNQDQLSNRNVTNAADLAAYTPSLAAEGRFGPNNSNYSIRGFVQEASTAPSVGVYFGEVVAPRGPGVGLPAGDGAGPGMFFDLQNVQVLKGPQGTLFGRNTTGGAVILVPQKPTENLEGYVEGSIGNYDMRRLQAVMNLPVADTVRLRLGGEHQKRDGYMRNLLPIGPRRFDDINYLSLRGSLVIDVTPDIENYTIASYVDSDTNGHVMKAVAGNCNAPIIGQICSSIAKQNAAGFHTLVSDMAGARANLSQWQVINNTKWVVSDTLTVKNIVSYARLKTSGVTPVAGTNYIIPANAFFPGGPQVDSPFNLFTVGPIPGGHISNHETFTEELRVEGSAAGGKLNFQAGIYYEEANPKGPTGVQTAAQSWCNDYTLVSPSCINATGRGTLSYKLMQLSFRSTGLYAQANYDLTDSLKLTGGIRYTWDKSRSFARLISYGLTPFVANATPQPFGAGSLTRCTDFISDAPPLCESRSSQSSKAPTWVLGLDFKPSQEVLLYAKYSRGYRSGAIKPDLPVGFKVLQPEKVDTFEVGAKTTFEGAVRGNLNIAAFYNNFSNQQVNVSFLDNPNDNIAAPIIPGLANVGKSRIWGIEADARVFLFDGFSLEAGYAYLDTTVRAIAFPVLSPTSPYIIGGAIKKDDPLVYSPKHKLSLTASYRLPLDESVGEVTVGGTWTYTDKQLYAYNGLRIPSLATTIPGWNHSWLPSRSLLNLNLNWDRFAGTPVDLALFATNVTNKKYYVSAFGLSAAGMETATASEPRMYGLRLRYSFGK